MRAVTVGIELIMALALLVIVASIFYAWATTQFSKEQPTQTAQPQIECSTAKDCSGNSKGPICRFERGKPAFCGCFSNLDCGGKSCVENKCQ